MSEGVYTVYPNSTQTQHAFLTYNSQATGAAHTMTIAETLNSLYDRSALGGSDRIDTTPTAAAIIGSLPGAVLNSAFDLVVLNNDTSNTLTIAGGTGVTITGTATVAHNTSRIFKGIVKAVGPLNAAAVTIYSVVAGGTF